MEEPAAFTDSITPRPTVPANTALVTDVGEVDSAFDRRLWELLLEDAPDVAEAMANPYSFRFAQIDSYGTVCNPAADYRLDRVNWRDPSEPLARRAAAFVNAQAKDLSATQTRR